MDVRIKKLCEDAVIPQYAHSTDAGLDLVATSIDFDSKGNIIYGTGIAVEIPEGAVGLLFPRSSISKYGVRLTNSVGVIDSGYRGEITFKFKSIYSCVRPSKWYNRLWMLLTDKFIGDSSCTNILMPDSTTYSVGDRIGQLIIMPYPKIKFRLVDELSDSDRGEGGYGSTGK